MKFLLGIFLASLLMVACVSSDQNYQSNQVNTNNKSEKMKKDNEELPQKSIDEELKENLANTISDWAEKELAPATVWSKYGISISPEIYYNKDQSRALMLFAYDSGKNVTTKLIPVEKVEDKWMFHPRLGMTFKSAYHDDKPGIEFYLGRAIERLVEDGLKDGDNIDSKYVNEKWFEEDRKEQFELFLKQEY